jgi:hypothetical protein
MAAGTADPAWDHLLEVGLFERHFNQLQATYRTLASTWLLATFAGIGFTLLNGKSIPIDWLLAAAVIAVLGAAGISLLWNLDLLVYHRLLDAAFYTGLQIEKRHTELPQLRTHMACATHRHGVIGHVMWFYIVGIDALLGIATLLASLGLDAHGWVWLLAALPGAALFVVVPVVIARVTAHYRRHVARQIKELVPERDCPDEVPPPLGGPHSADQLAAPAEHRLRS